jgi:hypothetical protein
MTPIGLPRASTRRRLECALRREQAAALSEMVSIMRAHVVGRQIDKSRTQFEKFGTAYSGVLEKPMSIHIGYPFGQGKPYWYPRDDEKWAVVAKLIRQAGDARRTLEKIDLKRDTIGGRWVDELRPRRAAMW